MTELDPLDRNGPPELRAADADRDRVAAILGQALAEGRLTTVEHGERIDIAYSARTLGELAPLVHDLPATITAPNAAAVVPATEHCTVHALLSKVTRAGRWVAGRRTTLTCTFGALIVDLSEAVLPGREITLELNSFCGKVIVQLPDNVLITDEGVNICSKRSISARPPKDDGESMTTVRITGTTRFSKLVVRPTSKGRKLPWAWAVRQDDDQ